MKTRGTSASWYRGQDLTVEERQIFSDRSKAAGQAKRLSLDGLASGPRLPVNIPALDPCALMPIAPANSLRSLSLFSGGGGLDLAFDRAGYEHAGSFELLEVAAATLRSNRPSWHIAGGRDGDVRPIDWRKYKGKIEVLHGGPPCQPFSVAGRQQGESDPRDMWPEFVRAVLTIDPLAFVGENVSALLSPKFGPYVQNTILGPLASRYTVRVLDLSAASYGVPQTRRRAIFVGFRNKRHAKRFSSPPAICQASSEALPAELPLCLRAREALGLPPTDHDALAPTMRSGFTGPRHSTSICSSASALRAWNRLGIWPNGVARTREAAQAFPVANGHFRLSLADCALLQGFPPDWLFQGPVYAALGQLGNAVAPPMGYAIARAVDRALL